MLITSTYTMRAAATHSDNNGRPLCNRVLRRDDALEVDASAVHNVSLRRALNVDACTASSAYDSREELVDVEKSVGRKQMIIFGGGGQGGSLMVNCVVSPCVDWEGKKFEK